MLCSPVPSHAPKRSRRCQGPWTSMGLDRGGRELPTQGVASEREMCLQLLVAWVGPLDNGSAILVTAWYMLILDDTSTPILLPRHQLSCIKKALLNTLNSALTLALTWAYLTLQTKQLATSCRSQRRSFFQRVLLEEWTWRIKENGTPEQLRVEKPGRVKYARAKWAMIPVL